MSSTGAPPAAAKTGPASRRRGAGRGRGGAQRRRGPVVAGPVACAAAVTAHPATSRTKGLGGEQVEGRQAIRELLLAGRRRVKELWISTELLRADGSADDAVADLVALAAANRVPVAHVPAGSSTPGPAPRPRRA